MLPMVNTRSWVWLGWGCGHPGWGLVVVFGAQGMVRDVADGRLGATVPLCPCCAGPVGIPPSSPDPHKGQVVGLAQVGR